MTTFDRSRGDGVHESATNGAEWPAMDGSQLTASPDTCAPSKTRAVGEPHLDSNNMLLYGNLAKVQKAKCHVVKAIVVTLLLTAPIAIMNTLLHEHGYVQAKDGGEIYFDFMDIIIILWASLGSHRRVEIRYNAP